MLEITVRKKKMIKSNSEMNKLSQDGMIWFSTLPKFYNIFFCYILFYLFKNYKS